MGGPTKDQALAFAIMLQAGLPPSDAIGYFYESIEEAGEALQRWLRSRNLKEAQKVLLGKSWTEMSLDEQCKAGLDYAYAGMAYFLFSHNYSSMGTGDQAKYNAARQALEARLAGTAGKGDALSRFLDDFVAGKLKGTNGVPLSRMS
jgi:hypothetical protein